VDRPREMTCLPQPAHFLQPPLSYDSMVPLVIPKLPRPASCWKKPSPAVRRRRPLLRRRAGPSVEYMRLASADDTLLLADAALTSQEAKKHRMLVSVSLPWCYCRKIETKPDL
jgi:hypothetical protein